MNRRSAPPNHHKPLRNGQTAGDELRRLVGGAGGGTELPIQPEDLFRCFMDGIPGRVYFKDRKSRFIRANQAVAKLFGLATPEELIGKTDFDFHSPEHAREAFADEQEIIRSGQPLLNKEECETWPDREATWVSTSKMPLRDAGGNIIGIFGISRDITERKRAQTRIQEQARLLDLVPDAILVLDLEGRIKLWNQGSERIYGFTVLEAVGKNWSDVLFKGVVNPEFKEIISTVVKRGEWAGGLEEYGRDGKSIVVQARASLVRDEQGQPREILLVNTDVTEKKKLEAQILRSQRMESLGTLAGGIAHDLNNVLSPLLISVQLLSEQVSNEQGHKLLRTMENCVQRGAKLIKQVLSFSRGIKGERELMKLDQVVQEVAQIINETFPKSVQFDFHCANDLWSVVGDTTQLHQVLLNLCVNARDAMPGGGKLSVCVENTELDEMYVRTNIEAKPGPYVVMKVTDNGTGMSKKLQERIFEPFFTTKGPNKGTGLGMSTCLAIVKSHGGFINCYSELGRGSVFKVYLPVGGTARKSKRVVSNLHPSAVIKGHNELVLVVDDEEAIRELAKLTLERSGYRVVTAVNGEEALIAYQQFRNEIAVVLMDISMPVMDGVAAIAVLKTINPAVRIIVASGLDCASNPNGDTDIVEHRFFISKPYTTESLLQTVFLALASN